MTWAEEVGRRIKEARLESNLTQEEVAKALGMSIYTISKYERGTISPSLEILEELSKILNKTKEYFFGYDYNLPTINTVGDIVRLLRTIIDKQEIGISIKIQKLSKDGRSTASIIFDTQEDVFPENESVYQFLKKFIGQWQSYETGYVSKYVFDNWIQKQAEMYDAHRLSGRKNRNMSKAERLERYKAIDRLYLEQLEVFHKENGNNAVPNTSELMRTAIIEYDRTHSK